MNGSAERTMAGRTRRCVVFCLAWPLVVLGCGGESDGDSASTSNADVQLAQAGANQRTGTAPAGTDNWSCFRGPGGMGVSSAKGLPVSWSTTENIAWKTPLPGPGASSPIVFGDRIYVTCHTGYQIPGQRGGSLEDLKRHLIAVRRSDGRILWDKAVDAKLPEQSRIRDHGYAGSTAAADAERVYVFFGKTGVFAFDHDGKQLWQTDVGSKTHGWGSGASPVLYKDLVFINASVESGALVALDRSTGTEKWRARGFRGSWNTPVLVTAKSGRTELVVAVQGSILAFDPDSGKRLWSCKTNIRWYMVPSIVAEDGVIYAFGGRSGVAALAVRAGGNGEVTDSHRLWTSNKGTNVTSPVVHKGHLYWTHEQKGIAFCAVAATGKIVYEKQLPRCGQVYPSALLADGKLYYLNRRGRTFVLAAKPEFEQLAVNDLSDRSTFNGSFAVAGKRLIVRSDKYLYCIGK